MSSDSGIPNSGNEKRATREDASRTNSGTLPGTKLNAKSIAPLLANHPEWLDNLYAEARKYSWPLSRAPFEAALERSAEKHFASALIPAERIQEYLAALHLRDLSLAVACAEGHPEAWEHFVATYRSYLRSAAAAIQRCPLSSPAARDLADSLFADLYGLVDSQRPADSKQGERSLFRYFHGRSSLKTWLRAVLAQRHIDSIRADRRFTALDEDADGHTEPGQLRRALIQHRAQTPPDPHRERYVALFTRTLQVAVALLNPRDHQRLRLYYAGQQTLAEIGRTFGEHESSVSRNLERVRRELRAEVERALRNPRVAANGLQSEPGLSDAEISLCFEYASEDAPIDLDKLFPPSGSNPERLEP
jgi:RNA polymerase sigma-70 factor (ECF subfamily)